MPCPHLKEVVMLYCDAFPVKKMVPLDRVVSADPCLTRHFQHCPLLHEHDAPPIPEDDHAVVAPLERREALR